MDLETQIDRLVELGYPALSGMDETDFRALLEPLREIASGLDKLDQQTPLDQQTLRDRQTPLDQRAPLLDQRAPLLVITRDLIAPEARVPLLRLVGSKKAGIVDRNHDDLSTFHPLEMLGVPAGPAYLLLDVERGEEFCGVRPEDALPQILARGRTPLTIDEGIALVTHRPDLLEKNKCFMLSGSRRNDRRVPALWISERAPKLGWCWDGNPHSWLGVASAAGRLG